MTLEPGEAVVLIIRRNETGLSKYFLAVRKSQSSINPATGDFQLFPLQQSVLELGHESDFSIALEKAIEAIREIQP